MSVWKFSESSKSNLGAGDASYRVSCFYSQWNTAFWVLGSSMCSFFLGEHIISFIFIMSLQQIFILDILRPRAAIFYKTLLSKRISDSQFVGFFFFLSLPSPSFFQGVGACGSKKSKEGLLFILSGSRKKTGTSFIYLFIYCISSPCVNIFCILKWWWPQTGACPDLCCFTALRALSSGRKFLRHFLWHRCSWLKINHFSGTLSTEKSEAGAGGGMNHSTLCNMLCLWTDLAVDRKQYFFKWKINPVVL